MSRKCDHGESLYGRCSACGMTWEQQADERNPQTAPTCERSKYGCQGHAVWHVWFGPSAVRRYAGRLCHSCADLFDPYRQHSTSIALLPLVTS